MAREKMKKVQEFAFGGSGEQNDGRKRDKDFSIHGPLAALFNADF
jgi:hypothetical protein